ncbi:MAG: N-acyl-D-glucosamine 2-epimerase [Candidatus Electrothrix sp. AW3_4]|nr:N-acyl-D-glucosamine 2-epimerase [Candidatus Electrothrix gigas]
MNKIDFAFSDLIAGTIAEVTYPDEFDSRAYITVKTEDNRDFGVKLTKACYAEIVRNLGEPFQNAPSLDDRNSLANLLKPGRLIHAYGIFYPEESGTKFEAKHLLIFGVKGDSLRFEHQDWWTNQVQQLANFYLDAQFQLKEGEQIDWRNFRTEVSSEGEKEGNVQNLDTISRLVYGFASAYMMTGDLRCLEAAESGSKYMQKHFRHRSASEKVCYWYSQINLLPNGRMRKMIASTAGGNEGGNAMPCYEQIYALAGLTQTYRITADPELRRDIDETISFMNRYFKDHGEYGGYFSHIDSITLSPSEESLGINKERKNWNSIGDHAPAYLINLWLATGKEEYKLFLEETFDLICEHFPDYDYSPFMNEKFFRDWSHDLEWGIHQARCVVGHNLKVAWNLTRMVSLLNKDSYEQFAHRIAETIPTCGEDTQRGGWYDMMERTLKDGEQFYRLVWHDRKAWWQQEQGILAYYIMAGVYPEKREEYLKHARMGSAFYNGWFLDYEEGGVYFNVLANGQPYALGTERDKGSHSMAGYHSFELCYLASIYTNLLINEEGMDLYFNPDPSGLEDRVLRVSPDILPEGSIKIIEVTVNGTKYEEFDSEGLTVTLPESDKRLQVYVRLVPANSNFDADLISFEDGIGRFKLYGHLNKSAVNELRLDFEKLSSPKGFELDMEDIDSVSKEGWNYLTYTQQMRGEEFKIKLINLNEAVRQSLDDAQLYDNFYVS